MNTENEHLHSPEAEETAAEKEMLPQDEAAAEEMQENIRTEAYAEGEAHARAAASAEITALRQALAEAERAAARREAEVICCRMLRERHLDEGLAALILPAGAESPGTEELAARADAMAAAVREAAMRELRERAVGMRPGGGGDAPLTGAMIREMPLAKLAAITGAGG